MLICNIDKCIEIQQLHKKIQKLQLGLLITDENNTLLITYLMAINWKISLISQYYYTSIIQLYKFI